MQGLQVHDNREIYALYTNTILAVDIFPIMEEITDSYVNSQLTNIDKYLIIQYNTLHSVTNPVYLIYTITLPVLLF